MIPIKKSEGLALQPLLEVAKTKDNENVYRCGSVFDQIKEDFRGKCYLCENDELVSIQIEHFEPHKKDLNKKFNWANLFYSCGHCNNIKGADFWPLLNCTDADDRVWDSIHIRLMPFPKITVEISVTSACPKTAEGENTRRLLEKAIAGKNTTAMKMVEADNLRKKMLRVYTEFVTAIEGRNTEAVLEAVSDHSPFAGMLRWHLKSDFPEWFDVLSASEFRRSETE